MATAHETCSSCGATLPAAEPGAVLSCHFCGTENRIAPLVPPPPRAPEPAPRVALVSEDRSTDAPSPPKNGGGGWVVALVALIPIVVVGFVAVRSCRSATSKTPLSALHAATIPQIHQTPIDAPPIVGSIEHFDVLANIDWATTVAHAWWSDAVLKKLEVDPVQTNGFANLRSKDAHAKYTFFSAQCVEDYRKRAETTAGLRANTCNLYVAVGQEGPWVSMSIFDDHGGPPLVRPPCPIVDVFARLSRDGQLPVRPTYAMQLDTNWHVTQGYDSAVIQTGVPEIHPAFCREAGEPYTR